MHRFLWLGVLMCVLHEPTVLRADEMRFYYFPVDVQTLAPVTREGLRATNCQGVIEESAAVALRAFVSGSLTRTTDKFDENGVRILIEGGDIVMAIDITRHMQLVQTKLLTYSLAETQLEEVLAILKATSAGKNCIVRQPLP